jgi:hypothetical protein
VSLARFGPMLQAADLVGRISAFSTHTYGDGDEGDATPGWYDGESERAALVKAVATSPHEGASVWMTEYGDLDQTGLIEWQFAWRSTRRLLGMLADGLWRRSRDAFDNLHEHDGAWATTGCWRIATGRTYAQEALLRGEAGVPSRALAGPSQSILRDPNVYAAGATRCATYGCRVRRARRTD